MDGCLKNEELDLDVFSASNSKEDECEFKVKGRSFKRSYDIYAGESSTIITQQEPWNTSKDGRRKPQPNA
ncbi:hypothetical protein LguiA_026042 [Lonicera macranthoides]